MAKMTLLDMTQNILSSLNSDQVNSIGDTPESLQVAEAIRTSYINLLGRLSMPEHNQPVQLVASNDLSSPTLMYLPEGCSRLVWLKYFDTNPADGNQFQTDQFGAYSEHDTNTDLQNNAGGWSTTSSSSLTMALGTATFTDVGSNLNINIGDSAWMYPNQDANLNIWMYGTVTGYVGTTLTMNVTQVQGGGTFSNWLISQLGPSALSYPGYKDVRIIPVNDFIRMTSSFNATESDVESFSFTINEDATMLPASFTFYYKNDIQPRHCCVINNQYVIFDSYDNTQDSTLQASKTMGMAWIQPAFQMSDTFTPNMDDQRFSLLLNEAKSLAFFEIKNQPHQKAEVETKRQLASYQKYKSVANRPNYFDQLPDYGRRGGMGTLGGDGWYWAQ